MATVPTKQELVDTLISAARAHHEFQSNFLGGVRHSQWAGWYAAYVLGRLSDFTTPTLLSGWLDEVTDKNGWYNKAAEYVLLKIENITNGNING